MALKNYEAPKPDNWVTLGGFTKKGVKNPTSIEGYYLGSSTLPNQFETGKTRTVFMLKTPAGLTGVNGNANLINRMRDNEQGFKAVEGKSPMGAFVRIECTGEIKTGKGSDMKTFSVQFDGDNTIPVAHLALPPGGANDVLDSDAVPAQAYGEEEEEEIDTAPEPIVAAPSAKAVSDSKKRIEELLKNRKAK